MKRSLLLFFSICPFIFTSCKKHDTPPQPQDPPQLCRITGLDNVDSADLETGNSYRVAFQYNEKGTPLNIRFTEHIYLQEDFEFRHDNKNRVTDVIRVYPNRNEFSNWHRLKYDNQNRIIRDSIYYGGIIGHVPIQNQSSQWAFAATFRYDNNNRIIQATEDVNAQGQVIRRDYYYYYGGKGNLDSFVLLSGPYRYYEAFNRYDTLVNIHRTNSLWQFLDRDYSKNNGILNTSAPDNYGLPTKMVYGMTNDRPTFLGLYINALTIEYACKGSGYSQ